MLSVWEQWQLGELGEQRGLFLEQTEEQWQLGGQGEQGELGELGELGEK